MGRKRKPLNKNDLSSRRRKKKGSKVYLYLFGLVILIGGIVFLLRLPALKIKEVKITDTKRVSASTVEKIVRDQIAASYLWVLPKDNYMMYPKKKIREEIMSTLPVALTVKVDAGIDRVLTVSISERLSSALWCRTSSDCFLMDASGVIFTKANSNDELLRYYGIVEGSPLGKRYGEEGFFQSISQFVDKMSELGLRPSSVKVLSNDKAEMYLTGGSYIIFPPNEKNKDTLFADIELFINDLRSKNSGTLPEFEYIDARYGNKIFYKIK
jgi:cell division septal protein FtsQ